VKRLFYIRHGQTNTNVAGIFAGHYEAYLTEEGQRQATETGKHARGKLPHIDVIICSPLKRAHHTAELIAEELRYPLDKIEVNTLFIERSFGALEGTVEQDFFATHAFHELDTVHGSETVTELEQRAKKALEYLKSRKEENILVISHGSFGAAFVGAVRGFTYSHDKEPKNAELVELI
jgi:broad specificity phosphatase PhoE